MRHAFASQNDLGRLCDEVIYRNDLAARLDMAGFGPVLKEVPVQVTYGSFAKKYQLDLVVGQASIYELKTVSSLTGEHESQLLNYLMLHDVHRGKLLNFRSPQVEARFVNTRLTTERRRRIEVKDSRWRAPDPASKTIREVFLGLLADWGGFLELSLYIDALTHFLGGEDKVLNRIPLSRNGIWLGDQRVHLAGPDTAFRVTAITENLEAYERQLRGLLEHSRLSMFHWVNLNQHQADLVTLTKPAA